ncbi:hypothetical protein LIA77_11154 [Sarocladium implicatum]|nr:hypothetical protein LIA77_11154 [Sarocladium implicatum]
MCRGISCASVPRQNCYRTASQRWVCRSSQGVEGNVSDSECDCPTPIQGSLVIDMGDKPMTSNWQSGVAGPEHLMSWLDCPHHT